MEEPWIEGAWGWSWEELEGGEATCREDCMRKKRKEKRKKKGVEENRKVSPKGLLQHRETCSDQSLSS